MPPIPKKKVKPFDSRKPLECCEFASLNRCLGVKISRPLEGRSLNPTIVDCECETISVNTITSGKWLVVNSAIDSKTVADVENVKKEMTEGIVADIDEVVSELLEHRERLLRSIS